MTRVQLAIQGGGAKFIHLLAAAQAFQEMHLRREISLTRVAGTSAGSLVAALVAGGSPISDVNSFIREQGPSLAEKIIPKKLPYIYQRSKVNLIYRALAGKPFFHEEILRKFIGDLFIRTKGSIPETIADCQLLTDTKLIITTSDIRGSRGHVFSESDNLIDAIVASCAVPFAFRTYRDAEKSRFVDGGICDNLPAEALVKGEETFGKTFAISPNLEPERFPIENPIKYVSLLFSASMNHNVLRSRNVIGKTGVITVDTDLKIFDFWEMLGQTDISPRYKMNRDLSMRSIVSHLKFVRFANTGGDLIDGNVASIGRMSASIYEVIKKIKEQCVVKVVNHTTSVFANCLIPKLSSDDVNPDIIRKRIVFRVLEGNMRFLEVNLKTEGNVYHLKPTIWSLMNITKNLNLRGTLLPLFLSGTASDSNSESKCVVCFDEAIVGQSDSDTYSCEWVYAVENCFIDLDRKGSDFIAETNGCGSEIEEMLLIAYLPSRYSQTVNVSISQQDIRNRPINCEDSSQALLNPALEIGYDAVGARIANVQPGTRVEMRVRKTRVI